MNRQNHRNSTSEPRMEVVGVRWRIWIGVVSLFALTATILLLFGQSAQILPTLEVRLSPPSESVQPPRTAQASQIDQSLDDDFSHWTDSVLTAEISKAELISELISELHSLDRNIRIAAATKLSWRLTFANEALPVLSLLAHDEPDDEVCERIREAILNIRGYDGGLF